MQKTEFEFHPAGEKRQTLSRLGDVFIGLAGGDGVGHLRQASCFTRFNQTLYPFEALALLWRGVVRAGERWFDRFDSHVILVTLHVGADLLAFFVGARQAAAGLKRLPAH